MTLTCGALQLMLCHQSDLHWFPAQITRLCAKGADEMMRLEIAIVGAKLTAPRTFRGVDTALGFEIPDELLSKDVGRERGYFERLATGGTFRRFALGQATSTKQVPAGRVGRIHHGCSAYDAFEMRWDWIHELHIGVGIHGQCWISGIGPLGSRVSHRSSARPLDSLTGSFDPLTESCMPASVMDPQSLSDDAEDHCMAPQGRCNRCVQHIHTRAQAEGTQRSHRSREAGADISRRTQRQKSKDSARQTR